MIKKFAEKYPKHKFKVDMITAIEEFADIQYWYNDGDIREIIKKIKFKPDFIFHYDVGWGNLYAPNITGLDQIDIPKGCFVNDIHCSKKNRIKYFDKNKIDLIFATYKEPFLKAFPQYEKKHRWMPFSINPDIIKDWKLKKNIDFCLMGQVYYKDVKNSPKRKPPKGRYEFREAVLNRMKKKKGFVFNPHPGHLASPSKTLIVNESYARELNRSKIFFTCGGVFQYAVAKFFEAPGCRTLLLAKPNNDIRELGFKDGENFVACNKFNFYDKAKYYINHSEERERITNNGYDFIHRYHTNSVRAQQFIKYVEDFLETRR